MRLIAAYFSVQGCSPPGVVKAAAKCLLLATLYNTYKAAKVRYDIGRRDNML